MGPAFNRLPGILPGDGGGPGGPAGCLGQILLVAFILALIFGAFYLLTSVLG